jgi:hypothetical protein
VFVLGFYLQGTVKTEMFYLPLVLTKGASPTCKAICRGREVLRKRLIRIIGDSRTTEILHDQWIDGIASMKPLGRAGDDLVQLVSDLIHDDSNQWEGELVMIWCNLYFTVTSVGNINRPSLTELVNKPKSKK